MLIGQSSPSSSSKISRAALAVCKVIINSSCFVCALDTVRSKADMESRSSDLNHQVSAEFVYWACTHTIEYISKDGEWLVLTAVRVTSNAFIQLAASVGVFAVTRNEADLSAVAKVIALLPLSSSAVFHPVMSISLVGFGGLRYASCRIRVSSPLGN